MDRYDGSDEGGDEQPQGEPVDGDASVWGLSEQPAHGEEPSVPSEGAEGAAVEYAAWSSDASYQQAQSTPATGDYTTEQPVAAFNDQQQSYGQQPTYDPNAYPQGYDPNAYAQQQAYAQQGYDPNAYAQQQQAYAQQQQQYGQQGYAQQGYDPNAYAQQQQQYGQQGYAQQGYYDPNAYPQQQQQQYGQGYTQQGYGQGYYDQSAYGQQPSYYDQQAYAQQQWQGYGAPGQPYAYAQPGQQPWPQDAQYWDPKAGGYGRSLLAVLAGAVLLAWGLVFAVFGGVIMWQGNLDRIVADLGLTLTAEQADFVTEFNKQAFNYGAIILLIGITLLIGGIGVFSHRSWGRAFGIVLGFLGILWGIALVAFSTVEVTIGDTEVAGDFVGDQGALAFAVVVLVSFILVFLAMFVGRRHFRRKGVA